MESQEAQHKTSGAIKILKIVSLGILGVAASLAAIGYAEKFFNSGAFGEAALALVFTLLLLAVVAIETLFVKRARTLLLLAFMQAGAPLTLFLEEVKTPGAARTFVLAGAGIMFLFQIVGMKQGKDILENSVKVKMFQVAKAVIPKTMTGVIAYISIIFYLSYFVIGGWNDVVGKRLSDGVWKGTEPILRMLIEGARADQTVDEFLKVATESELRKLKTRAATEKVIDFDIDLLAPEEKEARVQEIIYKIKSELERITGPIEGNEKMKDVFYETLKRQITKTGIEQEKLGRFTGIIAALLFFGFLKSLAFLITWIAEVGAFIIFNLLLAVGFGEIYFESASRERLEL